MVRFYYDNYDFLPDKKYLIFFRGGFCPPTRGHFSLVEKYAHMENVKYYISQIGSEARHGVPYSLNRKIWKIYIKKLLPKDRIILKKAYSFDDVLDEIEGIDVVIFIRGKEEEDIKAKEKERRERYENVFRRIRRRGVKVDFLIIDRPEKHVLSATKFIESLKRGDSFSKLKFFLPENLPNEECKYIIRNLKKQNLKV